MAVTLHCMKGSTELNKLRGLPGITLIEQQQQDPNKFLHLVFDEICLGNADFTAFESIEGFPLILEAYKFFLKRVIALGLNNQQVIINNLQRKIGEDLSKVKLDGKYQTLIVETVSARSEDARAALTENSTHLSQAYLSDFDWKVQLTLSSDKISTLRQPMLLLSLDVENVIQSKEKKNLIVELPKEDLDNLISKLEDIAEVPISFLTLQTVQELRL